MNELCPQFCWLRCYQAFSGLILAMLFERVRLDSCHQSMMLVGILRNSGWKTQEIFHQSKLWPRLIRRIHDLRLSHAGPVGKNRVLKVQTTCWTILGWLRKDPMRDRGGCCLAISNPVPLLTIKIEVTIQTTSPFFCKGSSYFCMESVLHPLPWPRKGVSGGSAGLVWWGLDETKPWLA